MKQHITPAQIQELSEPAKDRLREWCDPDGEKGEFDFTSRNDCFLCVHWCSDEICSSNGTTAWSMDREANNPDWWRDAYPLLNIGQMIQFLQDKHKISYHINLLDNMLGVKFVLLFEFAPETFKEELCDALWASCVEILEQEGDV